MLVLSSRSRLLGSNPIVWLCGQEPVKSFRKGPPLDKEKPKRWWTYLSQFRLIVHHIPGRKNELSDYISRNNFDALIGESSEALAKEAFQRMDVQLDLSVRTAGILEGWSLTDYQSEYKKILQTLSTGLEPRVIDGHQWYKNNQYLFYEDRIVVPEARLDGCLQWSHLSSGHTGVNRSVDFFRSENTGEQEPSGPGHRTRNTTHRAGTPVNRSQEAQDTAHAKQHTERAHR